MSANITSLWSSAAKDAVLWLVFRLIATSTWEFWDHFFCRTRRKITFWDLIWGHTDLGIFVPMDRKEGIRTRCFCFCFFAFRGIFKMVGFLLRIWVFVFLFFSVFWKQDFFFSFVCMYLSLSFLSGFCEKYIYFFVCLCVSVSLSIYPSIHLALYSLSFSFFLFYISFFFF